MKAVLALALHIVHDGERLFVGNMHDSLHTTVASGGSRDSTESGWRTPW